MNKTGEPTWSLEHRAREKREREKREREEREREEERERREESFVRSFLLLCLTIQF